jgi:predicted acetyltransferase
MVMPEGFREVELSPQRHAEVLELDVWAFPSSREPEDMLAEGSPLTWERARGIEVDGHPGLVGMRASYPFGRFPVPGGTLPVAGLTWVGVHPEYRRRGLLSGMIAGHFADCAAHGEAVSALTASEPAIYGRFGYGLASRVLSLTLARRAELRPVPGSAEVQVEFERFGEAHLDLVADLHARAWPLPFNRPGWVGRETPQLAAYLHADPPAERDGSEAMRILVARRDGQPCGYAVFRRKSVWREGTAEGEVAVRELVALDAAARHALLSRLLDLDLTSTVRVWCLPVDDPILDLLVDLRATRPRIGDNIWLRLVDLPAALAGRRYAAGVDVVLGVTDALLPANAGTWRLRAEPFSEDIEVTRTTAAADVRLDVRELGALYLGGGSMPGLAAAGLVDGPAEVLGRLHAAFAWPLAPASSWVF